MKKILNIIFLLRLLIVDQVCAHLEFQQIPRPAVPDQIGRVVERRNFFKDIMGKTLYPTEESLAAPRNQNPQVLHGFKKFQNSFFEVDPERGLLIKQAPTIWQLFGWPNTKFQCGSFQECSLGDLQDASNNLNFPGEGTFNVFEGLNTNQHSWFRPFLDIGALQANPDNADAVFQVASNFNGLETTHADQDFTQQLLADYIFDRTQGPAASISAAPGLILRRYLLHFDQHQPDVQWGQTLNNQINFLSNVANNLPISPAGYVVFDHIPLAPTDDDLRLIKIGYHENVQVTHGLMRDPEHHYFIADDQQQIINQVFTAAIDLGVTNRRYRNNAIIQQWAQTVLNAAYEGTLRKAFIENKRKVFLTLVGGGVFGNDITWIIDALDRMRDFIRDSGLEVILIWYCSSNSAEHNQIRQRLAQIVTYTNGQYTQCTDNQTYHLTWNENDD